MKISMICYTLTGQQTGEKLKKGLEKEGNIVSLFTKSKYIPDSIKGSCGKWTGEQFETADSIIFIGAAGIAVRSIAPFIQSKKKDPAVLVVDELGKFVISLLSGHLGGANELACLAADILQAIHVVTTATDLEGKFAVDVFAKKNNCHIFRMKEAKEVSAALLAGEHAALPALHHRGHLIRLFISAEHHVLRGGAALQKAGGIGAVRRLFQLAQHLGRAGVLLRGAQAYVQRPAVCRGGAGRIIKGFCAALYLQAGDARLHQLAQKGRGAQIVRVQNIAAALVLGHVEAACGKFGAARGQLLRAGGVHRLPLPAAGLRAGAAVCIARREIVR